MKDKLLVFRQSVEALSQDDLYVLSPTVVNICAKLYFAYMQNNPDKVLFDFKSRAWKDYKALSLDSVADADAFFVDFLSGWVGSAVDVHYASNISRGFYDKVSMIQYVGMPTLLN